MGEEWRQREDEKWRLPVLAHCPLICPGHVMDRASRWTEYIKTALLYFVVTIVLLNLLCKETLKASVKEILRHQAINSCQSNDSLVLEIYKNSGKTLWAVFLLKISLQNILRTVLIFCFSEGGRMHSWQPWQRRPPQVPWSQLQSFSEVFWYYPPSFKDKISLLFYITASSTIFLKVQVF